MIHVAGRLIARTLFTVERLNDTEEEVRRISICEACPNFKENSRVCGICLCYMDEKTKLKVNLNATKARHEQTHCPIGKWGDIEIANHYRNLDNKELLKLE